MPARKKRSRLKAGAPRRQAGYSTSDPLGNCCDQSTLRDVPPDEFQKFILIIMLLRYPLIVSPVYGNMSLISRQNKLVARTNHNGE